jgi:hypothetical protein
VAALLQALAALSALVAPLLLAWWLVGRIARKADARHRAAVRGKLPL